MAVLGWMLVAVAGASVVWKRLGEDAGAVWITGYILEFIFSIENIFVFHVVITSFGTGKDEAQKALTVVVLCQIAFQMVFYMGLAHWLRSISLLPYVLGLWLMYVGAHAASESHATMNMEDTSMYKFCMWLLGKRFYPAYKDGSFFCTSKQHHGVCATMLVVVTLCLLAVDFFLEIDVTLTKIEGSENCYLAFTSSVVAAFVVPQLYFVARELFQRYSLLKHGIAFVLVFFGVQMLLHTVFVIPELLDCGIILAVMAGCMVVSP
jgi:tellurite resistance protein TerC